jgi:hypothetical protein
MTAKVGEVVNRLGQHFEVGPAGVHRPDDFSGPVPVTGPQGPGLVKGDGDGPARVFHLLEPLGRRRVVGSIVLLEAGQTKTPVSHEGVPDT